MQDNTKEAGHF